MKGKHTVSVMTPDLLGIFFRKGALPDRSRSRLLVGIPLSVLYICPLSPSMIFPDDDSSISLQARSCLSNALLGVFLAPTESLILYLPGLAALP